MDSKWAWAHERCFLLLRIKSFVTNLCEHRPAQSQDLGLAARQDPGVCTSRRARLALSLGPGRLSEVVLVIHTFMRFARRLVQCIFK